MKQLKYFIALLLLVAVTACGNDPTETIGPDAGEAKTAFLKETEIGVYQNSKAAYTFDKTAHQLYVSPSDIIMRIQDDKGAEYVELQLNSIPAINGSTKVTLRHNIVLQNITISEVSLLKEDGGNLWLWSEAGITGFILPWSVE